MKERLLVWIWIWFLCWSAFRLQPSAADSVPLPEITDTKFISECVKLHNEVRSLVEPPATDMLHMTWDAGLAKTAQAWARHCDFSHNIQLSKAGQMHPVFRSVGENLWVGTPPSTFTVSRAMDLWVNEKEHYSYRQNTCTDVCGHYTQVVWASSFKVGCAVQVCPKGVKGTTYKDGALFVCNYATAGNMNGQRPYKDGTPCSNCDGQCTDRLCRDPERDAERRYNWTPDWDPSLSSCGPSCIAVLVMRPLALICTFMAAYGIRSIYPDIFCYQ
ncbi:GLIPR1-like protein 1 [Lampris incognitus]|uniref:GLIPR1-like protein 1 n=1 Tax=Lampris incognitus TaxID=2546036 RepID=UPI0024B522EC|nr:GLIPR1-like protein 1 [Lampris incognitus]XP_056132242.1 GLIPR1-like protein 1 [Lampris incognitus]